MQIFVLVVDCSDAARIALGFVHYELVIFRKAAPSGVSYVERKSRFSTRVC